MWCLPGRPICVSELQTDIRGDVQEQRLGSKRHADIGQKGADGDDRRQARRTWCGHFSFSNSRWMAAAKSVCPCCCASAFASVAHLTASSFLPSRAYPTARPNRYRGVSASRGSTSFSNWATASSVQSEGNEHPADVEACEAKEWLHLDGAPVQDLQRRLRLALTLQSPLQVVEGPRVHGVGGEGLAVGLGGLLPLLLQGHQDAEVVVRIADVAAKANRLPIVLLALRPVSLPSVERNQVRMGPGERRFLGERGLVGG